MRAEGVGRNGKLEAARLAGIVLMLSGVMALTFAVVGVSSVGATKATPANHPVSCQQSVTAGSPIAQVLTGILNDHCNDYPSTTNPNCGCTSTTVRPPCTCTTSTLYVTTTTAPATTTSASTTSTEVSGETSTLATTSTTMESTTMPTTATSEGPTNAVATSTTLTQVKGVHAQSAPPAGPQISVSPTSEVLPFTGTPAVPLAGLGFVLIGTGFGLTRRNRRFAR